MFSKWLLDSRLGRSEAALERVAIAKNRILSVLDRETVARKSALSARLTDRDATFRKWPVSGSDTAVPIENEPICSPFTNVYWGPDRSLRKTLEVVAAVLAKDNRTVLRSADEKICVSDKVRN